jgi:hypothetical protein
MQMKYLRLLLIATCVAQLGYAQNIHMDIFGGTAAYLGDLTNKIFPRKTMNGAIGLSLNYQLNPHLSLKSGLTYGLLEGADRLTDDPSRVRRNLSFKTNIFELTALGELYLFDLETRGFSPYGFTGLALFHFNPYAFNNAGNKIFLRPLSTEGQGLAAYPDRKPYHLIQLAIPYGGGIKFKLNEQVNLGFEIGLRKLFTEYLDDVSTEYVDVQELMNAKGPLAVEMSYRGDELDQGIGNSIIPYPAEGTLRGDPSKKDAYYFSGLQLSYLFGSKEKNAHAGKYGRMKNRFGCPSNVY